MTAKPAPRPRLQKHLASLGVGSRRMLETWIAEGKIRIDGRVAKLGERVGARSRISIDGKPLRARMQTSRARVILYHKPEGEISTRADPGGRPTVFARLPKLRGARWVSVGRLDINTRGVLLFTDSGELANQLMHPRAGLEREYLCRVYGEVDSGALETLRSGMRIGGEFLRFEKVQRGRGDGRNAWFTVVVRTGRYREIRRLWESANCKLSRLIRVRYGEIALPKNLAPGQWRELPPRTVEKLLQCGRGDAQKNCAEKPARKTAAAKPKPTRKNHARKNLRRKNPAPKPPRAQNHFRG